MSYTDDEKMDGEESVVASRLRVAVLLAVGAAAIAFAAYQGMQLYPRLPDRMPTHFGASGEPDGWGVKSWFSVFGILAIDALMLAILGFAASGRLGAKYYNFPGKERVLRLPREQQDLVMAPLREGMAWMASAVTVALAMMARDSWLVALGERGGISVWPMPVALAIGMAAVIMGIVKANRRAAALGEAGE